MLGLCSSWIPAYAGMTDVPSGSIALIVFIRIRSHNPIDTVLEICIPHLIRV